MGVFSLYGIFIPFWLYFFVLNLIKCKFLIHAKMLRFIRYVTQGLVWRLSEFAFLCGYFGGRTFYFYSKLPTGLNVKEKTL